MATLMTSRAALTMALAALAAAGCAAGKSGEAPAAKADAAAPAPEAAGQTSKAGPAVEVAMALRAAVNPGEVGVAILTITDDYSDLGELTVTASSKTGLGVYPTSETTRFAMDGDAPHLFDVYFRTDVAGVHYLDVYVRATDAEGGVYGARSFSFAVKVGDVSTPAAKVESPPVITDADGETVIMLDAVEEITPPPADTPQ